MREDDMHLNKNELQDVLNQFGNVMAKYDKVKKIAEDLADSDMSTALEELDDEINKHKRQVAAKIRQTGLAIVQEGHALPDDGNGVTMPAAIGCDCPTEPDTGGGT